VCCRDIDRIFKDNEKRLYSHLYVWIIFESTAGLQQQLVYIPELWQRGDGKYTLLFL
jgi:hypothetical protein